MKNKQLRHRRRYYHNSPKAGVIYCQSSYEIKAAILLDSDPNVATYKSQEPFKNSIGKRRYSDFLVYYKSGTVGLIEVKPKRRLDEFKEQVSDNQEHATKNGYIFNVWTETELGFTSGHAATKWADEYLGQIDKVDYTQLRKERATERGREFYRSKQSGDKVTVACEFCRCNHTVVRVAHSRNVTKNGRFICIHENGHLIGKREKVHQKNPLAAEGRKKCSGKCGRVLTIEGNFSPNGQDKWYSQCKQCRTAKAKETHV